MSLRGRRAVVTGGSRGIGTAVARALASQGVDVLISSRAASDIEAVAAELGGLPGRVLGHPCDVTDADSVTRFFAFAGAELGAVDILVNNAGISGSAPIQRITLDDWNRMFAVNATGTLLCTQAVIAGMRERGWGRVVNVASVAGLRGEKYIGAYSASKHAVLGLTRSIAAELADTGVTINAICPGYVDTPMTESSVANVARKTGLDAVAAIRLILDSAGQARLLSPEEVAEAVLSLCADGAAVINGEALVFDAEGGTAIFGAKGPNE